MGHEMRLGEFVPEVAEVAVVVVFHPCNFVGHDSVPLVPTQDQVLRWVELHLHQ